MGVNALKTNLGTDRDEAKRFTMITLAISVLLQHILKKPSLMQRRTVLPKHFLVAVDIFQTFVPNCLYSSNE